MLVNKVRHMNIESTITGKIDIEIMADVAHSTAHGDEPHILPQQIIVASMKHIWPTS